MGVRLSDGDINLVFALREHYKAQLLPYTDEQVLAAWSTYMTKGELRWFVDILKEVYFGA